MKRRNIAWPLIGLMVLLLVSFQGRNTEPVNRSKSYINKKIDHIIGSLDTIIGLLDTLKADSSSAYLRNYYFDLRKDYKHIECFVEYYSPHDAKYFINGPLVKKSELEYGKKIYEPRGFQVLEQLLFEFSEWDKKGVQFECKYLRESFISLKQKLNALNFDDKRLFDMIQFELYRIACLNINGYDATITKVHPTEAAWALEGCIELLQNGEFKHDGKEYEQLMFNYRRAEKYCIAVKSNDSFNRLFFITRFVAPLYNSIVSYRFKCMIEPTKVNYALNLSAPNMFSKEMFNPKYFSVNTYDTLHTAEQANLGKLLFYDPILSGNNKRSCASCHNPSKGFSDGLVKALNYNRDSTLIRNSPSLLNSFYQRNFFYDGRSRQLEQQINDVLHNKNEMNTTVSAIIEKLNSSLEYKRLFRQCYKGTADTAINYYGILKAITEFEKTLDSRNSRFDKYLRGDFTKLNSTEIKGYNLFTGKAQCGTCHFLPLFTGLVPPYFNDTEYEVIGVSRTNDNKEIDEDPGRIVVSLVSIHKYAFKTTSVRNVAFTAPYMHNGVYSTLDQVLDFYNNGGGKGMGYDLENQTLPFDSLQLTKLEMLQIKKFMFALSDTTHLTSKPLRLPKMDNSLLNKRKIGGEY